MSTSDAPEIQLKSPLEIKKQLPWFQFFVGDTARRTQDMDAREFGAYMLLLMYHWEHGRLPAEKDMRRVSRVDNSKAWSEMKEKVVPRVLEDVVHLEDQKADAKSKSKKAKIAADTRWKREGTASDYANA